MTEAEGSFWRGMPGQRPRHYAFSFYSYSSRFRFFFVLFFLKKAIWKFVCDVDHSILDSFGFRAFLFFFFFSRKQLGSLSATCGSFYIYFPSFSSSLFVFRRRQFESESQVAYSYFSFKFLLFLIPFFLSFFENTSLKFVCIRLINI